MKTPLLLVSLFTGLIATSQITTPIIKAGFGVDAELRANYFNNFVQSGNDDWFSNTPGTGTYVIDTTGAAWMMNMYALYPEYRKLPFFRVMRVPQYSIVNNRLWIDAVYIRDYNGQAGGDSTAFVTSNKNGDSPQNWTGGVTSVLDKNDIAEMMVHVRRAGPTKNDSLWFFGGISLQGTSGNRYFDFELYQTDIFYSRTTGQFSNYGPDAGHTSWVLDAAGNVTAPGDVIFTAEYSSSSLTFLEARVWIHRNTMNITPLHFDWVGNFDGASVNADYGYANIRPKTIGAYYTGLQSVNNTWTGPFGFVNNANQVLMTYTARQFMEFSVNLTKLGLDPITLLGGNACGLPFRRILVKTRTSTSFTSELKDFIGPFDFFSAQPVQAMADIPIFCGIVGVSTLQVVNPASASVYTWSTPDGQISGDSVGATIQVTAPGMYIVQQQLLDGCSSHAYDTVYVDLDTTCIPMQNNITAFRGNMRNYTATVDWKVKDNQQIEFFELERSYDGTSFVPIAGIQPEYSGSFEESYSYQDNLSAIRPAAVYYRLKVKRLANTPVYSNIVRLTMPVSGEQIRLYPNPATNYLQITMPAAKAETIQVNIFNSVGGLVLSQKMGISEGLNTLTMDLPPNFVSGSYMVNIVADQLNTWKKFVVSNNTNRP